MKRFIILIAISSAFISLKANAQDYRLLNNGNYALIQAEDSYSEVRFKYNVGSDTGDFVYGPVNKPGQPMIFLAGLSYRHTDNKDLNFWYNYAIRVRIRPIEGIPIANGDPVGFLVVNGDTLIIISYQPESEGTAVYRCPAVIRPTGRADTVQIGAYQNCEFAVDWFKVCNNNGARVVENHIVPESVLDDPDALPYYESLYEQVRYNNEYFLYYEFLKTMIEILQENYRRMGVYDES